MDLTKSYANLHDDHVAQIVKAFRYIRLHEKVKDDEVEANVLYFKNALNRVIKWDEVDKLLKI